MLVRFSVNVLAFVDLQYLYAAIYTIATAAANTTPSPPTGISNWEVLNNTTGGGWSPVTGSQSTSLTIGTGTSYASNYMGLIAPTPKTGVYKAFELYTTATTTNPTNGLVLARVSQYNGSSISSTTKYGSSCTLGATLSSATTSAGRDSLLGSLGIPNNGGYFYVSATSAYIWIYCSANTNIVGCGDLTSGSSYDYDTKSLHFPAAGMLVSGGAASTSQSADYYQALAGVCNFQRGETSYDFNDIWGTMTQNIAIPGITTGSYTKNLESTPFLPTVPAFGTVLADNTTYKSTWSSDGYFRYSINDISLYNPWQGYPIRTIAGLKIIGWDRYNTSLPPTMQYQRVQVGSQKYMCMPSGTGGRVIFGFAE